MNNRIGEAEGTEGAAIARVEAEELYDLLAQLSPRDQAGITFRRGLRGEQPATLEAVGQFLGITREGVRTFERDAMGRLQLAAEKKMTEVIISPRAEITDVAARLGYKVFDRLAVDALITPRHRRTKAQKRTIGVLKTYGINQSNWHGYSVPNVASLRPKPLGPYDDIG